MIQREGKGCYEKIRKYKSYPLRGFALDGLVWGSGSFLSKHDLHANNDFVSQGSTIGPAIN